MTNPGSPSIWSIRLVTSRRSATSASICSAFALNESLEVSTEPTSVEQRRASLGHRSAGPSSVAGPSGGAISADSSQSSSSGLSGAA